MCTLIEGEFLFLMKNNVDLSTHQTTDVKKKQLSCIKKGNAKQSKEVMNTLTGDDVGWRSQGLQAVKSAH